MARTSLLHAKLPQSLWMLALKHSAFIFNRVAHAGSTRTPYEICISKKLSLNMVCVFGCQAYLHGPNYKKQFVSRATPLIHVGVSEESHGWLLWESGTKNVQRGASVVFHEDNLTLQALDVKSVEAIMNSIQVQGLGDFTQLKEFNIQDAFISSTSSVSFLMSDAPDTYHQAIASEHSSEWLKACDVEIGMMVKLGVCFEVPCREEADEILNCQWVFALKRSQEGEIIRFKARIVAQGFWQIHGVNVGETFAPTPTFSSLQLLLAMALQLNWPVASFDARSAFLHSNIDHNVYIQPPPGVQVSHGKVLKLRKALYGTWQASCCWWLHLKSKLGQNGFFSNLEDQSTYTYQLGKDWAFLWIHIYDSLFTASSPEFLAKFKAALL
jgi:hypothetical protein